MDIDSMDEIISMSSSKDLHHSMIIKRKRTKRPRQPSPASPIFTVSSSSSGGDGGSAGGGRDGKMVTKIGSSESLCSDISTSTEEDEDMANCLILLAQSGHQNSMSTTIHLSHKIEKPECGTGSTSIRSEKDSSRKLKEMTITTSSTIVGKASVYVYECKTCNRSFPTFQALGGHRTSHKKHKPTVEMEDKIGTKLPQPNDHHGKEKENKNFKISPSSLLSLEISKKNPQNNVRKIHECSICGAEFSSGQALGGHMRRHRNLTSATTTTATATATATTDSSHDECGGRPRNILELDLNLPAVAEDGEHDSKLELSLFSSPALVDWQY